MLHFCVTGMKIFCHWTFNNGATYPLHEWEHFYCSLRFVENYSFGFGSVMKINKVLLLLLTREMGLEYSLRLNPGVLGTVHFL